MAFGPLPQSYMLPISINIKGIRTRGSKARFTKALHARMKRLWQGAIRAFIEAVLRPNLIKVDTGMAKATILPLARAVRLLEASRATINPITKSRKGFTELSGQWNPLGKKSAATGEKLGQDAFTINFGSPQRILFRFEFRIVVFHFILHELGLVPGSGPWNILGIGNAAFLQYIADNSGDIAPEFNLWVT